ncbi:MAG TPA: GNAT family protein [Flavisolibacter sp.]|nr:GNAT family protein [Flavisolibacter sp.]
MSFPQLFAGRFLLEEIGPEDQAFIFEGLSHPKVIPYYGVQYASFDETGAQMEFYASLRRDGTGTWWKIVDQASGQKLGAVGYNNYQPAHRRAEIGYWLLPAFWGKGIVTEVLPVLLHYLFEEIRVHRIEAMVETANSASAKLLQKLGFTLEGSLRDYEIKNGRYISLEVYSLLSHERQKR